MPDAATAPMAAPDVMHPVAYDVIGRRELGADTATLTLAPAGPALAPPRPGQFYMLWVFGVGEVPISLGGIGDDGVIEETVRAVGAVSRALVGSSVGDQIGVRGPYGSAWDLESAEGGDLLVVAGGVGLVPLRPALSAGVARHDRFRRIALVVGARTPADLLFRDQLDTWAEHPEVQVVTTVDHADRTWHGHVGVVTEVLDRVALDPAATVALVCGPEMMMRFTAQALDRLGVPAGAVQLSLERNMKCAVGHCGHCQLGGTFVCLDGPVVTAEAAAPLLRTRER